MAARPPARPVAPARVLLAFLVAGAGALPAVSHGSGTLGAAAARAPAVWQRAPVRGPVAIGSADRLYVLHCAGCHGLRGAGLPHMGVPPLREGLRPFLRVREGRAYLVQVPGVMNSGLDDAQVAQVANWVLRELAGAGDAFVPYTGAEVAGYRDRRPLDVGAARARALAAIAR